MTAEGATDRTPNGVRAWCAWIVAVAFVVYYFSFQTGYAIVNAKLQQDLRLSVVQIGMAAALYTWVFAVCQFFSGPLLDRLGARRILVPAIVLVTAGIFVFATAGSFEALVLSQCLVAIGACSGFVGAGYVGGQWFGMAKFSFMFGLVQFAASLFSAFSQNLLSWALLGFHWQDVFMVAGGLGIILFGVAVVYLHDPFPVRLPPGEGFGSFLVVLARSLATVARVPHVWIAAIFGALCFGVMLALGVVWAPKLLIVRGLDERLANLASSLLWLGLATGCFILPWSSDRLRRRKLPMIVGTGIQIVCLVLLLYAPSPGAAFDMALCFIFGIGNAAHMLAFRTAGDVVEPRFLGTSSAVVNGTMFIVGGMMISRPGVRVGLGLESGLTAKSLELAQFAAWPLLAGICLAFVVSLCIRETFPGRNPVRGLRTGEHIHRVGPH